MAWTCVFSKQSLPPALCGHTTLHQQVASRVRPPFSLRYGGNLPSSLTTVRPSPRYSLPDHLCRFRVRAAQSSLEAFLGSIGSMTSPERLGITSQPICHADLPTCWPTRLPRHNHSPGSATFLRHPIACLLPTGIPQPPTSDRSPQPARAVSTNEVQHGRFFAGTGISTRYPSTTPLGLALGPDSPRAD